ncbi:2-5A-dependent ribonuclease-like isoform X2 [Heterodontus francisci]|uniref:2-5A-dependent ribonuclease-like isoform X2 n=1 Tax=Heterodontus francisci TaxID=7792 RepID=UPI00355C1046
MAEALDASELSKKLHDLCVSENPDLSQVESLIKDVALGDSNADMFGAALCLAAFNGHESVAELLLNNKANVNYQMPDYGWTPLLNAVQENQEKIVDLLLKHKAVPGLRKKNGATPFILAAITGHVNLLQKFLTLGADVDEMDDNGFTAFMEAAYHGKKDALYFLFQQKSDVNKQREVCDAKKKVGKGGKTALMDAVMEGHEDIVKILLDEMCADVNALDNLGKTVLIHALAKDKQAIVETLLDHGADVNTMDNNRNTPLSIALTRSPLNTCVVELLLKYKPNLNIPDNNGKTPLILAVEKSSEVVKLLLEDESIEINAQDNSGRTALLAAVENKDASLTKLLCERGADVSCMDKSGNTPFMIVRRNYDTRTKEVLITFGAKITSNIIKTPSSWKQHSVRWRKTLRDLQEVQRAPIGNLKLSRIKDYMITENNLTEVYLGFYNNETEVAVKCHRKGSEKARKEMDCLRHPTILDCSLFANILHCERDEYCDYICLNLCEYNLEECVNKSPEEIQADAPEIMKQLVQAVQILHKVKFAHRDLHPTNVLRDVEKHFRLADFDNSVHFGNNLAVTITPGTWEASEILQKLKALPTATFEADELFKADLQALGRLLHYIMTGGKDAYMSEEDLYENNYSLDEVLCKPENAEARDLVKHLLASAEERATLSEVEHHPFLWKKLDKSQFVQSFANEKDVMKRNHDSQLVQILNQTGEDQERSFHKWTQKVYSDVLNDMNKKQGKNKEYKDTASDLLKFIRNLIQHFDEKKEFHSLLKSPEEYCFGLFPDLIVTIYNAVKHTEWNKHFPKD